MVEGQAAGQVVVVVVDHQAGGGKTGMRKRSCGRAGTTFQVQARGKYPPSGGSSSYSPSCTRPVVQAKKHTENSGGGYSSSRMTADMTMR